MTAMLVRPAGFEPTTCGLGSFGAWVVSADGIDSYGGAHIVLQWMLHAPWGEATPAPHLSVTELTLRLDRIFLLTGVHLNPMPII